jgi:hypothetical protein
MKRPTDEVYPNKGSAERRLHPRFNDNKLGAKVGPKMGMPAIHETSSRNGPTVDMGIIHRRIAGFGVNRRFVRD